VAQEIRQRAATARRLGSGLFERGRYNRDDFDDRRLPLPISEAENPAFALEVISALMARAIAGMDQRFPAP
jgi:hypothetical protein